jgi:hypothetical protein
MRDLWEVRVYELFRIAFQMSDMLGLVERFLPKLFAGILF